MELYKYCDKNGVDILRHKVLKVSTIDEFNDPFEFKLAKSDDKNINKAVNAVYKYQKESYRVVCLTAKDNNLILWSHYAKKHTGILIKFNTELITVNGVKLSERLEKVIYSNDMIKIPDNFSTLGRDAQQEIIFKNTYRKFTDWIYEEEYRAIVDFDHAENKRYIELVPESILEVVLGMNCDLATELSAQSILKNDEYRHVKFKRSFLHEKEYKMKYVDMI